MRVRFYLSVIITISAGIIPEYPFVPDRQLHCQGGKERGLASTPAQSGPHTERAAIVRQLKVFGGLIVPLISRVMHDPVQNPIEWNCLAGIKKMIKTQRSFTPIP